MRLTAVFAKKPEPGRVKTRLCPPLTPAQGALLAEAMLADVLARLGSAPGFRCRFLYAPADAGPWVAQRFPGGPEARPQEGRGLAERLATWFEAALGEEGVTSAVALGSDAPLVPTARVDQAHDLLARGADLVLGPDRGGGYYLVGLRAPHRRLFTEVTMSSAGMCAATVALARAEGLRVELLEPGDDVDVAEDLARLAFDLARLPPGDPDYPRHTAAVLAKLPPESVSGPRP